MFKHLGKNEYEIVNAKTDMVMTVEGTDVKLDSGKQKPGQIFALIQKP